MSNASALKAPVPHTSPPAREQALRPEVNQAHVRFIGLGKTYPGQAQPALQGIDLNIRRGEIFGIITQRRRQVIPAAHHQSPRATQPGPGADRPDRHRPFDEERLVALRRRIGMIFQHFNLMSAKTVWQNVELPLKVAGVPKAERQRKVSELLELVGLAHKHHVYPAQLSGGQKQRVGIARALVHDPEILLCDEATSALDPETTASILDLLRDINQRLGLTVVLITHEMAVIRDICHRVVVLERGEIVEQGEVWRVFGSPRHEVTRTLLAPLQARLPAALQANLRASPTGPGDAVVLRLNLLGEPQLSEVFNDLGGRIRLLQGGIETIGAHALGQLVLSVQGSPHSSHQLLERARRWAENAEVLGYVA